MLLTACQSQVPIQDKFNQCDYPQKPIERDNHKLNAEYIGKQSEVIGICRDLLGNKK